MRIFCILLLFVFYSIHGIAQPSILSIHSINVNHNQEQKEVQASIVKGLTLDQPTEIMLWEEGDMSIIGTFEYARSGNRIKVVTFIRLIHKGSMFKSKKKKYVQFIKASVPRELTGVFADNYFIDKPSLNSVNLRFKFDFKY